MTAIEQLIETARKQTVDFVNSSFDVLLEKVKENIDFLAYMNGTNATFDPANGEYVATMFVEAPPSIPDLEDVKPLVEEVKERFDLQQESKPQHEEKSVIQVLFEQQDKPEWAVIETESELFKNVCAWVINGEKETGNPVTDARLFFMQEQKKVRFTKKDFDHIQNLMWWRSELKKGKQGDFSLKDILTQNSTFDWEKPLWEALAKTIK